MSLNGIRLSQYAAIQTTVALGIDGQCFVPVIGVFETFDDALCVDTKFNSRLSESDDNECEGVVIKPYNTVVYDQYGSIFYIKKKNEKFAEKMKHKEKFYDTPSEVLLWKARFDEYITQNRVYSAVSKLGEFDNDRTREFVLEVVEDAKIDFNNDEEFFCIEDYSEKELKVIFKPIKNIYNMLLQS